MRNIIITLLFIMSSMGISVYAQDVHELPIEEKNQLKARIVDKLDDFQFFLGEMADKKNSQQVRTSAHKSNILLFIGKCEPYTVTNISTGALENKEAVKMETSSISNGYERRKSQTMKQYFTNILNNRAYSNIKIEQSKAVRVDKIRKVGEGKYEAIAHIHQYFAGYGGEMGVIYSDHTEKAVKIIIDRYEVSTSLGVDIIYEIKLGDMKVSLTERL